VILSTDNSGPTLLAHNPDIEASRRISMELIPSERWRYIGDVLINDMMQIADGKNIMPYIANSGPPVTILVTENRKT
jgi:hypothetical protein